jgi:hypothetical protein
MQRDLVVEDIIAIDLVKTAATKKQIKKSCIELSKLNTGFFLADTTSACHFQNFMLTYKY